MHLIYRRAQQTVALFNNPVTEQKHLNVFNTIKESSDRDRFSEFRRWKDPRDWRRPLRHTYAPFYRHLEAIELTEILASDKRYTRAWTLQETLVSGGPLHHLIPYLDTLKVPPWMESLPQQLIISETLLDSGIHYAIFDWLRSQAERETSKEWSDLYDRGKAAQRTLSSVIAEYKIDGEVKKYPEQARISAVAACGILASRGITEESDLIAILGNLCQYNIRLNSVGIRKAGYKFPLCAYVLSVLNGDMSLIRGVELSHPLTWSKDKRWTLSNRLYGSSLLTGLDSDLGGGPDSGIHKDSRCRICPPKVAPQGLLVTGILFKVTARIRFADIQTRFAAVWKKRGDRNELDIIREIFWAILEHMEETGFGALAKKCLLSSPFRTIPEGAGPVLRSIFDSIQPADPPGGFKTSIARWVVSHIMGRGVLNLVEADDPCAQHGTCFLLHSGVPKSSLLLSFSRVLVMEEKRAGAPLFLFMVWVGDQASKSTSKLDLISALFKVKADGYPSTDGEICLCGDRRHFSTCLGKEYLIDEH